MARTKAKTFKKRLEERIIEKLIVSPSTITAMATTLGENYYSVRRVFKELEEAGFLYQRGYDKGSAVYKLTEPDPHHKNDSIPVGKGTKGPIKLTAMLDLVGSENKSVSASAATALPRNLARIFMAAIRHVESGGTYDTKKNISNIRLELETNLAALENVVGLYKTILQADVFWDEFKLRAVPYDESFDRDKAIQAYKYYYPED